MTPNEYQDDALRTWNPNLTAKERIINAAMGIGGEAGEAVDYIKKYAFHGHDLDQAKVAKELGDICWYVAVLAAEIGYSFETVLRQNIAKLKARYPDGFSTEASKARVDGG